jgi:hypothetical protein
VLIKLGNLYHDSITSLTGLLSQESLAKGVLGSVLAYSEEGGNAELWMDTRLYYSFKLWDELTMKELPELLHKRVYILYTLGMLMRPYGLMPVSAVSALIILVQ